MTFTCFAIIDWKKGLLDKGVSYFLAMALWITQGTLVSVTLIHKSRKGQFEKLIELWTRYDLDDFLSSDNKHWAKKCITAVFFYIVIFMIVAVALTTAQSVMGLL